MCKLKIVYGIILLFAFCSCRTSTKIVEVDRPVYIHDTTDRVREVHDTTEKEVVKVVETKGDTVFVTVTEKEKTKSSSADTVYKYIEKPVEVKVPVPVETPVEVPRELTAWQKFKMSAFWWLSAGLVGFVLWKTRRLWLTVIRR